MTHSKFHCGINKLDTNRGTCSQQAGIGIQQPPGIGIQQAPGIGFQPVEDRGIGFQPVENRGIGFQPVENKRNRRRQHGITLMEIMISMGVALVGIVGIMALMPLAAHNLSKGVEADAASTFGRGALHDFNARNMIAVDWIAVDPANNRAARLGPTHASRVNASFCIDPLYMASHTYLFERRYELQNAGSFPVMPTSTAGRLPYSILDTSESGLSQPRMLRASLPFVDDLRPLPLPVAERIFVGQDDLAFERPDDDTLPPLQAYNRIDDVTATDVWQSAPRMRQARGRFSWMATIVPEIDTGVFDGVTVSDEFRRLSIVIFHDRVIDPTIDPVAGPAKAQHELLFDVVLIGGGVGGGDMHLVSRPERGVLGRDDLGQVRQGNWIMLGGSVLKSGSVGAISQFRWYRVVDTATTTTSVEDYNGNTVYVRPVTLTGPDWTRSEWTRATYDVTKSPDKNLTDNDVTRTQATWLRGVVSVLEKNVVIP
jgi:hypothetical protein